MKGAHTHLVSVTFHGIQSVEAKLSLLDSCLALVLAKDTPDWKTWRTIYKKAKRLNGKRNKIVHEPVSLRYKGSQLIQIAISPSHSNALAIAKGQTTYSGATVGGGYSPSAAKLLPDHKIEMHQLFALEQEFKAFSEELQEFRTKIEAIVDTALAQESQKGADGDT